MKNTPSKFYEDTLVTLAFALYNTEQVGLIFRLDIVGSFVDDQKFDFVPGFFDEVDNLEIYQIGAFLKLK